MKKYFTTLLFLFLLVGIPAGFALAQTPTPSPTPTSTFTNTPGPSPTPTATATSTPEQRGLVPVGAFILYSIITPPDSAWLICDGRAVSRTTYAKLFAVIGGTYGVGDGVTTFNLPDFRGRVPVGSGAGTGLSTRVPGQMFGEETHTLTVTEMPPHTHVEQAGSNQPAFITSGAGSRITISPGVASNNATPLITGSTGGGAAFNQMQPSTVVAYFIYAGEDLTISGGATLTPATPDGATVYSVVVNGDDHQTVAIRYEVTPGDIIIASLLFVLVGLILVQMYMQVRRLR